MLTPGATSTVVAGEPVVGAHVVLDPGHGGDEPGAVGPTGLTEKELNLDIALRVRDLLEAQGATVVLTRDRDVRITLATRATIARTMSPIAFLSIHHNAAPVDPGSGFVPTKEVPDPAGGGGSRGGVDPRSGDVTPPAPATVAAWGRGRRHQRFARR